MKTILIALSIIVMLTSALFAEQNNPISFGLHAIAGGRYDDVRMCVGSPAGVKGGPIMDVYLDIVFRTGSHTSLVFNLPVMRPVLFSVAFKMLQFEPQVTFEYSPSSSSFVFGAGMGAVFHYGPDYRASLSDRGEEFAAKGPLISLSAGKRVEAQQGYWLPGFKVFYSPLYSKDKYLGTVVGAAFEFHYRF